MSAALNAAGYTVHRDHDPVPRNPEGIDFVLTPRERSMAAAWKCQLERNRRLLNQRETAQAAADALERFDAEVLA